MNCRHGYNVKGDDRKLRDHQLNTKHKSEPDAFYIESQTRHGAPIRNGVPTRQISISGAVGTEESHEIHDPAARLGA